MFPKSFFLSIIFTLSCFIVFESAAQKTDPVADSLGKLLNDPNVTGEKAVNVRFEIGKRLVFRQPDSAELMFRQALDMTNDPCSKTQITLLIARAKYAQSKFLEALSFFRKSEKMYPGNCKKGMIEEAVFGQGVIYDQIGEFDKALEMHLKALEMRLRNPEIVRDIVGSYMAVGAMYQRMKDNDTALEYRREALQMALDNKMYVLLPNIYGDMVQSYQKAEEYDSAYYYAKKGLELSSKSKNNFVRVLNYVRTAEAAINLEKFDTALSYANEGLKIAEMMKSEQLINSVSLALGRIYSNKGDINKAEKTFLKALEISETHLGKRDVSNAIGYLLEHYIRYPEASDKTAYYAQRSANLKDSMWNEEKSRKFAQMSTAYETAEKEKQIALEKQKNTFLEEEKRLKELQNYGLGAGLVLVLLFAVQFFRAKQQKQKDNYLLQDQKDEIQQQAEELKVTNDKLTELSRFKESMTGMAAHDLKNPLNSILHFSDDKRVKSAGQKMLQLIQNMLDVQKFEEAEVSLTKTDLSLDNLFTAAETVTDSEILEKGISIQKEIRTPFGISADREITERVIQNLLSNAVKFTPSGGDILLLAEETENGKIRISVHDTGPGVPHEKREQIFGKYYQAEARDTGRAGSSGLGLTFCRLAAEGHGAEIGVGESELGGAEFFIVFEKSTQTMQSEKLENNTPSSLPQLSEGDKKRCAEVLSNLRELRSHQYSEVRKVLDIIENSDENLQRWKEAVQNAALHAEEETYQKLIS